MITPAKTLELLSRMVVAAPTDDGVRVSTHVLYPSNGAVSVVVRGGENSFLVSDEGGGAGELASAGLRVVLSDRMILSQIRTKGLHVQGGSILSPMVPLNAVPAAIMLVANASRTLADWGLGHFSFVQPRNFRADLAALLDRHFHDSVRSGEGVIGKSNKEHKFGHVIHLSGDRKLLIDPVVNEPSSINARLVSNLDVHLTNNPLIKQIIVYDDQANWKSSDLALLEIGARTVAFSRAEPEINRLAA